MTLQSALIEDLESRVFLSAQLIGNIAPVGLEPSHFGLLRSSATFRGNDQVHGRELWLTDGTPSGTRMIVDLSPGRRGSDPIPLFSTQGLLYFTAHNGIVSGLFATSGKGKDTQLIRSVSGVHASAHEKFDDFAELNGRTIFSVANRAGSEVWITDGTTAGTMLLANTAPRTEVGGPAVLGNFAYFVENDGPRMFRTDGTPSGTVQFGPSWDGLGSVATDGTSLFVFGQVEDDAGVWIVNTKGERDFIFSLRNGSISNNRFGGNLIAIGENSLAEVPQIYRYEGSAFRQISSFANEWFDRSTPAVELGESLVTVAEEHSVCYFGPESEQVQTLHTFESRVIAIDVSDDGTVFAAVDDGKLYRLSIHGGAPVAVSKAHASDRRDVIVIDGRCYFATDDTTGGSEAFWTDSAGRIRQATDLASRVADAHIDHLLPIRGGATFTTTSGDPRESGPDSLWFTDGVNPPKWLGAIRGSEPVTPGNLLSGGRLAFYLLPVPSGALANHLLYRTDGTRKGTRELASFSSTYLPPKLIAYDGTNLIYSTTTGRTRVFSINATTGAVVTLLSLPAANPPGRSVSFGGTTLFIARGQVWRTDGTPAGTRDISSDFGPLLHFATMVVQSGKDLLVIGARKLVSDAREWRAAVWRVDAAGGVSLLATVARRRAHIRGIVDAKLSADGRSLYLATFESDSTNAGDLTVSRVNVSDGALVSQNFVGASELQTVTLLGGIDNRIVLRVAIPRDPSIATISVNQLDSEKSKILVRDTNESAPVRASSALGVGGRLYLSIDQIGVFAIDENGQYPVMTSRNLSPFGTLAMLAPLGNSFVTGIANDGRGAALWRYQPGVTVLGTVFRDSNSNGLKDVGEAPLSGWRAFIDSDDDGLFDVTELFVRTNINGEFLFPDVVPSSGVLRLTKVAGFVATTPLRISFDGPAGATSRIQFGVRAQ